MVARVSEMDVAALVVAYFESAGHDVYQEVVVPTGIADIVVATTNREYWIVETKVSWSLDLLAQCLGRRRHCHRVFAAVPSCRGWSDRAFAFRDCGIGCLRVKLDANTYGSPVDDDHCELPPRLVSKRHTFDWTKRLDEGHKTHAKAGAPSGGGRWTPWRQTCEAIAREVQTHPGCTLTELITRIKHHYSSPASARSSIAHWVGRGKVAGVRIERDGKAFRLFPAQEAA